MMRMPDALPLQMMLALMQAGLMPNALAPWSGNLHGFTPAWMHSKTPLEQSIDQMTDWASNLQSQTNEQWQNLLSAFHPAQKPPEKSASPFRFSEFFDTDFLNTLGGEAFQRSQGFLQGIQAYLTSDYKRPEKTYDVLWARGSAQLFDLAPTATDALAVLCIPSLINRSTILDLYPEVSFVEFLKSQGFRPLLLDWGTPGDDELDFSTADYINAYAIPALQALRESHDGPIALLGYCMGGIFATAMAQLAPLFVDALVLLATPWDFASDDTPRMLLDAPTQLMLRQWIGSMSPVPPLVTQTIFHLIDPWRVQEKYSRYPE